MKVLGGRFLTEDDLRAAGLSEVGEDVRVHETAVLVDLDRISIGSHVRIDPYAVLSAASGSLTIGSWIHIGSHVVISAGAGVSLGDFSGLSQSVRIYSVSDDYSGESLTNPTIPPAIHRAIRKPVSIGRHAILGSGTVVLPGADVGDGCAVGALSLVNRPLPTWGIYAGVPVQRIRDRSQALLKDEKKLDPG